MGRRLVMHCPEPELEQELERAGSRHAIWGLAGVYGEMGDTDKPAKWERAQQEFVVTIAQDPGKPHAAPNWALGELTKTHQIRIKATQKTGVNTGGFVSASKCVNRGPDKEFRGVYSALSGVPRFLSSETQFKPVTLSQTETVQVGRIVGPRWYFDASAPGGHQHSWSLRLLGAANGGSRRISN